MKRIAFVLTVMIFASSLVASARAAGEPKVQESLIVSTEWLAAHLKDESLVLLQVGDKDEYLAGHIPGAQFITTADISTPRGSGLTLELPAVAKLESAFEKLGVNDKSRIVVYFGKDWVSPTTRVFFTLDYLGLGDRASILDGGLPAWRAAGKSVTSELTTAKPGHFTPRPKTGIVVNAAWVNANLNKPGVMILVRARQSSIPERKPDRCRAPVIFPKRRTFRSQAWSKTQTNSKAPMRCANSLTPRA